MLSRFAISCCSNEDDFENFDYKFLHSFLSCVVAYSIVLTQWIRNNMIYEVLEISCKTIKMILFCYNVITEKLVQETSNIHYIRIIVMI